MKKQIIGIMGAMPEEIAGMAADFTQGSTLRIERGQRVYDRGIMSDRDVVLVYTRCGKVAAATTAAHLIIEFGVTEILFTGVAGAADPALRVGDVVIGSAYYQHDMDARPLFARHEIPLLGTDRFLADPVRVKTAMQASTRFLASREGSNSRVVAGAIASGDKFFACRSELDELRSRIPEVACVEMEGAAVAQVCHEYGIPLTVIRTISDSADEQSPVDFATFIQEVASAYSRGIVRELLSC
ncbi:MAG: 5'-methylthioadenosine/S-adenosylhomocysteine nucleosidase [Bdellovibrionales bacterium GWB1_55_8]|nr:MAG: 5'-methylthioadenosine/S-adenosylhomocysteine nucleosidase [Bdellovibrionales bacterium GWB1_55_8]